MGGWIVCVLSWFYGIYEGIMIYLLNSSSFKNGKVVLKSSEPIPLNQSAIQVDRVYKTRNGKFKFVNRQECLFRSKFKLFVLHTPFFIK